MAVPTSFKQQCPSCEAMVPIRDPKLIGRKIDCPKCKYRFIVEEPVDEADEAEEEEAPVKKGKGKTGITNKKTADGKGAKAPAKRRADDDQDAEPKPKKKQGSSGMLIVGIALAAVAVIALAIGGVFLFSGDKDDDASPRRSSASAAPSSGGGEVEKPKEPPKKEGPKPRQEDITNLLPNDTQVILNLPLEHLLGNSLVNQAFLKTPGAFHEGAFQRIWGIAPSGIRRVVLASNTEKKTVFSVMRTKVALKEKQIVEGLKLKAEPSINGLKFYLLKKPLDALSTFLLKGDTYHEKAALHFMDPFTVICTDAGPMNQFLQEKEKPKYLSKKSGEEEKKDGGAPPGVPGGAPPGVPGGAPPGAAGGAAGVAAARRRGGGPGGFRPPPGMNPGMVPPGMEGDSSKEISDAAAASSSYMTVDPQLKAALDQAEKVDKTENQHVLLSFALSSSAVSLEDVKKLMVEGQAQAQTQKGAKVPEVPDFALKMGLETIKGQLKAVAVAVTDFNESKASVNVAAAAKDSALAQDWEKKANELLPGFLETAGIDLVSRNAGRNNNNMNNMAGMQGMPGGMRPPGGMPGGPPGGFAGGRPPGFGRGRPPFGPGAMQPPAAFPGMQQPGQNGEQPEEKGKLGNYGLWTKDNVLATGITCNIPTGKYKVAGEVLEIVCIKFRSVAAMSDRQSYIHELAAATQAYFEEKGHFPRGAVQRGFSSERALDWRPDQRLSWMAELLPYLANGEFKDIMPKDKDKEKYAWHEGPYIKTGMTVIPQFVTPIKSDDAQYFYVPYPNLPLKGLHVWAATHFVGMAGVGLDAAEYRADDTATSKLHGVFGYDRETKKEDIKDGLNQTIALIQVPLSPKSPWIAGGGSTVRGVSEDLDCVQPFVCTEYQGKRGTFAIMADGKVRFIPATIDPKTFQALCTIAGGDKIKDLDKVAPEVPLPEEQSQPELKAEQPAPPAAQKPTQPPQPPAQPKQPPAAPKGPAALPAKK